jgi:hypothetical protein
MQDLTLTVAIIVSVLVIALRPQYALAAYLAGLLWYPAYLAVSVGTIDILVGRFVVGVLLLRCLCDDRIRSKFVWCRLDTLVTLGMVVFVVPYFITSDQPVSMTIQNRGGFLMDTWCAYLAARFIITSRARLLSVIKCVGVLLVPLAVLGVIESTTGWRPFYPLVRYSPWFREGSGRFVSEGRLGLARAVGPFSHPILFGGSFAMFLPLIYYLRHEKDEWHSLAYILSVAALLGAFSSMSSGPWVMMITAIFCLAIEGRRKWIKPMFGFLVFSCIFVEIAANRPFYYVIASWANPLGGAGWHRAKLIDLAIQHFGEWWEVGYGLKDPGWGPALGMGFTDVTNQFILVGVRYGILGVIVLCLILVTAFRGLISTHRKVPDPIMKSLCWAFGSLLFSTVVCWMSVSFFGQLMPLFYCCLGMIGSLTHVGFNWQLRSRLSGFRNVTSQAGHSVEPAQAGTAHPIASEAFHRRRTPEDR